MKSRLRHYLIVATGIALFLGPITLAFNCAGIYFDPVSKALNVGKGEFAVYMTITLLTMFVLMPVAGKLMATLAFLAVPTLLNRWFRTRVGFFIGIVTGFSGVGGVLFNPLGGYLIANHGWQMGYRVFSPSLLPCRSPCSRSGQRLAALWRFGGRFGGNGSNNRFGRDGADRCLRVEGIQGSCVLRNGGLRGSGARYLCGLSLLARFREQSSAFPDGSLVWRLRWLHY